MGAEFFTKVLALGLSFCCLFWPISLTAQSLMISGTVARTMAADFRFDRSRSRLQVRNLGNESFKLVVQGDVPTAVQPQLASLVPASMQNEVTISTKAYAEQGPVSVSIQAP